MNSARDQLLQPSLSRPGAVARAPYSSTAGFVASFFGGPFSAVVYMMMNTHRLGRWRQEGAWCAAAALAALLWLAAWPHWQAGQGVVRAAESLLGQGGWRYVTRLFALGLCLAAFGLQRDAHRAADLFGLPRPNGWLGGLMALLGGTALTVLVNLAMATS